MHDTLRAELKQQAVTLSLAADDAALFERYARWLRSVLVSRGMCTEHLALVYIDGDAGRLEQARDALLAVVREAAGASAMRDDDQRYMVSYLIDAVAAGHHGYFEEFAGRFPRPVGEAFVSRAVTLSVRYPPARAAAVRQ